MYICGNHSKFTKNIIVGCVYRPSNTDIVMFNTELSIILDSINANSTKLAFILGDFNTDLVKSDVHIPPSDFLNIFTTHSIILTILYPTRTTDTSSTLIDNIFINNITHPFDTAMTFQIIFQ